MRKIIYILLIYIFIIIPLSYCIDCNDLYSAFDPLDCYDLDLSNGYEKCCLLEYKDKGKNRKFGGCYQITLEEFEDIKKTISDLEKGNENITITNLLCDKSSFLFINNFIIILALLLFF